MEQQKPKLPRFGPRKPTPEIDLNAAYNNANKTLASRTRRTRRVLDNNRERGYITYSALHQDENKVQEIVAIVRHLQSKGIFIPRIEAVDAKNNFILFEKAGTSLMSWVLNTWGKNGPTAQQKSATTRLFAKAARHLAELHNNGITHGHPHFKNFIVSGNKVGTIDYKRALKINWKNPTQANAQLITDWYFLEDSFSALRREYPRESKYLRNQEQRMMDRLSSRYSQRIKQIIQS